MLKKIVETIVETKRLAETEVPFEPVQTYQGRLANKKRAMYELDSLMVDYRNAVMKHSLLMLATGEEKQEFVKIADEEFECVCFPAETLFTTIASKIDSQNYIGKKTNSFLLDMIEAELKEIAWKAGIQSMPELKCENKHDMTFNTREEFEKYIKTVILEYIGSEILVIIAISEAAEIAINQQRLSSILPIVMFSDDLKLLESVKENGKLFTENIFTISCGKVKKGVNCGIKLKEVTKEEVQNALIEIKSKLS